MDYWNNESPLKSLARRVRIIIDAGLQMRNFLRTETWQLVAAFEST
ncbi:MAG: hypothetical protein K9J25_03580 [Bacteroidales bacterium]|nr:hypothetical protein [Bacteroidales bacterium]